MSTSPRLLPFLEEFIQLQVKHGVLVLSDELAFCDKEYLDTNPGTFHQKVDEESVRKYVAMHLDPSTVEALAPLRGKCLPVVTTQSTEMMQDSVRHLLIHLMTPSITVGGVMQCMKMAGIDTSHWPEYYHLTSSKHQTWTKAMRAQILWHCMAHAALNGFSDD